MHPRETSNTKSSASASFKLTPETPVQFLRGVGPKLAPILEEKGIRTVRDLLFTFPRAYEDRRSVRSLDQLEEDVLSVVSVDVDAVHYRKLRNGRRLLEWKCHDATGTAQVLFFHVIPGIHLIIKAGARVTLVGKPQRRGNRWQLVHPQFRAANESDQDSQAGIRAIYPEIQPLTQNKWQSLIQQCLSVPLTTLTSPLEEKLLAAGFPPLEEAVHFLHAPPPDASTDLLQNRQHAAFLRFVYEEFFMYELGLCLRRDGLKAVSGPVISENSSRFKRFLQTCPFSFTSDQTKVITALRTEMSRGERIHALLQGDVGSGKTVVALSLALHVIDAGYQAVLMAPTELLAEQHFRTVKKLLPEIETDLLVGSLQSRQRKIVLENIQSGLSQLVIGTHAVIQESVNFSRLGLVIVDEQHRFGVQQRLRLAAKAEAPHQVHMTATPIPRTLALTLFGDMDVHTIREKPAGRRPIKTKWVGAERRDGVYGFVVQECMKGRQAYVVFPLIEESETLDLKNATDEFQRLREKYPTLKMELLHGKLPPAERDDVMRRFLAGDVQLLVSTTVIEVGVDVPNATVMVIENAERFGLSQLHQLRGRVGRGEHESWCVLITGFGVSGTGEERLSVMEETEDGFEIAERDLEIRGPGEFLGERQSGLPSFRYGNLMEHQKILVRAREEAQAVLRQADAEEKKEWKEKVTTFFGERLKLLEA